jgi:Protein of unknown function (DUF3593)
MNGKIPMTNRPRGCCICRVLRVAIIALGFAFNTAVAFSPSSFLPRHVVTASVFPSTTTLNMLPADVLSSSAEAWHSGLHTFSSSTELLSDSLLAMSSDEAEALGGPLFGLSLFPYLVFLYFLNRDETNCPKGVTVGFASLLLFVFLTIPAAIVAKLQFGVSLADSDWLHGSAESLLTITNLVTVVAFRQALNAKEQQSEILPVSAERYGPMIALAAPLILLAGVTAFVPGLTGAEVHTPYLNGFMDLPHNYFADALGANPEPDNALTVAT